ncbi:hypothetical protein JGX37_16185, partial [Listeria monocytogenes]|nr:hypothetical protein [Listeria monocytogenes]MCH5001757.1 hypothetical protein [Listeria monocytogenes]
DVQIKAINIKQILDFFESPLGETMLQKKDLVKREVPFSYLLPLSVYNLTKLLA